MYNVGRAQEGGRLAVHKVDFNSHYQGQDFRHGADNIDMNPSIPNVGGTTVQGTLENLTAIVTASGSGFISIGNVDGYSSGTYNMGTVETPTFAQAFAAAQADERLSNGGVILVMAGTYQITSSVTVNPGITVMGEVGGTYLIGETNEQSLFIIEDAVKDLTVGASTVIAPGSAVEKVKFYNLIMFDNLNSNAASGGASMASVGMISLKQGGNFECEQVSFFGKLNSGSVLNRIKTQAAIKTISGTATATYLTVKNCFFDGLRNGIIFNPQAGDLDHLEVTGCRGRWFGKEAASYSASEDSFIFSSLCFAQVNHNSVTSGHANAKTLLNLGTTGGTTSALRVMVSGNTGSISVSTPFLVDNDSGVTFNGSITNNNWGVNVGSPWYIVVGGSDGDFPMGDIFGPNAINTIMTWGNSLGLEATVIVNPGTYTVTLSTTASDNVANLKFIGNKKGRNYPIFQLNIGSSTTDNLGNRFLVVGNHLESIYFRSITSFQSVRPAWSPTGVATQNEAHTLTVKDCIFYDTSLNFLDSDNNTLDQLSVETDFSIIVENCSFKQLDNFPDNISLVAPKAFLVSLRNCYFQGNGYAFNLGTEGYSSGYTGATNYYLENVTAKINVDASAITGSAPGTGTTDHYVVIKDSAGYVYLNNCEIFGDRSNAVVTNIDSSLLTSGSFSSFILLDVLAVTINNSFFNGPNLNYQVAATDYALPCVAISVVTGLNLQNSKFHSGGLPLQIKGTLNPTNWSPLLINGCDFQSPNDDVGLSMTMLDIEFEPASSDVYQIALHITNCGFMPRSLDTTATQVRHTLVTGAAYDGWGIVQLYTKGLDCVFNSNRIFGPIVEPTTNPFTHMTGLMVNTFSSDSGNVSHQTSVVITNNTIKIHDSSYNTGSASNSASAALIRSTVINVSNNHLNFDNAAAITASFAGCLVLDGRSAGGFGDANISNNYFNNVSLSSGFTALSRGYILILSTTTIRGKITDNGFANPFFDGVSNSALIEDNSSTANKWTSHTNKNQTKTVSCRGNYGKLAIKDTATLLYYTSAGLVPSVPTSNIGFVYSSSNTIRANYLDTADDQTFIWTIPVIGLVPENAFVVSVSVDVDVTANPSTTSVATLTYQDTAGSTTDVSNPLTTSGDTLAVSMTTNANPVNGVTVPVVTLTMNVNSSSTMGFFADPIVISYRW